MTNKTWVVTIEVDESREDYFITLPPEILETLGWDEGDELEFIDNGNGTLTIEKRKEA
jgi:bifunctional DNA-binding transcriptional regulator/antitoxin component of YhaV-PrlF toxin-antitoxin module